MKTFEYRLFVTKHQQALLVHCLRESPILYNEMLEITKAQYAEKGTFPSKYDLTKIFAGRGGEHVPATTVQMLADRLSKSLKRFLARKELAMKGGFPRFKKGNQWHSIQLRQYGKDVSAQGQEAPHCAQEVGSLPEDQVAPPARRQAENRPSGLAC